VQPAAEMAYAGQERMGVAVRLIVRKPVAGMLCATRWKKDAPVVRQTAVYVRGIAVLPIPRPVVNRHLSRTVCAMRIHPVAQETGPRPAPIWRMGAEAALEIVALQTALRVVPIPLLRPVFVGKTSSAAKSRGTWIVRRSPLKVVLAAAETGSVRSTRIRVLVLRIARGIVVEMAFVMPRSPAQPVTLIVALVRGVAASPMIRRGVMIRVSQPAFVPRTYSAAMFHGEFNVHPMLISAEAALEIVAPHTLDQGVMMRPSKCASARLMTSAVMSSGMMSV